MGFHCDGGNTLLYADLFKERKGNQNTVIMSTCESSSSGFSTPVSSELGSSESDDSDFIDELTRQMAECMLQEEEQEQGQRNIKNYNNHSYTDSAAAKNFKNRLYSNAICSMDQTPPLQVYQLKNQPPMRKQVQKPEQNYVRRYRGRDWRVGYRGKEHDGSGMRAIFLGGSGFRNGSSGTGVFLPNDPVEQKKKSGCSTVLIPTRVLEALELHFQRHSDPAALPLRGGFPRDERTRSNMDEVMQLPQEWTY
ncbi:hypothetical protein CDL12_22168 [Handroanthus impetiginosus]|uniref:Uncharacterized protein n=1 Tax=Handroanthus impetiginosus TaxID=429701 RepID=A0A2G9GJ06_9LAMI|nr:hypothetical protein CDL12_22168 [Handroanthus impetiginosus]